MKFTDDEYDMMVTALLLRRCVVETGTITWCWTDALRMERVSRDRFDIREPTYEQLAYGKALEDLVIKLGQYRMNGGVETRMVAMQDTPLLGGTAPKLLGGPEPELLK